MIVSLRRRRRKQGLALTEQRTPLGGLRTRRLDAAAGGREPAIGSGGASRLSAPLCVTRKLLQERKVQFPLPCFSTLLECKELYTANTEGAVIVLP